MATIRKRGDYQWAVEVLQALSDEVAQGADGASRTLLVCCAAFRGDAARFPNLTVKKIPRMVLKKCEWGHDDYSLNVENLPQEPKPRATPKQAALFGEAPESEDGALR